LPSQKQEYPSDSKPYDSTLKALFGELVGEIIPCLLSDARLQEGLPYNECNVEVNRTTLSIDLGYWILYKEYLAILNMEAQSGPDDDLLARMLEYAINLYRKYKRQWPIVSAALFLFKCAIPEIPFRIACGDDLFVEFRPIIIRMWEMDPQKVVDRQQRCLYPLLPTMKNLTVDLLKQALQEMHEHDPSQFLHHAEWFNTMLSRTTTVSEEDKHLVKEHLRMQYKLHPLLAEDPTIQSVIAEGIAKGEAEIEARGIIKGLQEGIIDLINDHFPTPVVTRVQQTIASSKNIEQLKKLHRQIARASDEEEVYALLSQYFPVRDEETKVRIESLQEAILDIAGARFSAQAQAQVQQAIAPIQDVALLRKFHLQLACLSDEEEVYPLLGQCFPTQ
jgi:predicted transposase YdaD